MNNTLIRATVIRDGHTYTAEERYAGDDDATCARDGETIVWRHLPLEVSEAFYSLLDAAHIQITNMRRAERPAVLEVR